MVLPAAVVFIDRVSWAVPIELMPLLMMAAMSAALSVEPVATLGALEPPAGDEAAVVVDVADVVELEPAASGLSLPLPQAARPVTRRAATALAEVRRTRAEDARMCASLRAGPIARADP
ncbi:hypothetical protein GCM10028801_29400 [Nocardioides maradonensis]